MRQVFITGVSRGIGRALALRYLSVGDRVAGTIRRPSHDVVELENRFPNSFDALTADVRDNKTLARAASRVEELFGYIDIAVCNAGVNPAAGSFETQSLESIDDDVFLDTLDVNVLGVLRVAQVFHQLLRAGRAKKLAVISSGIGSIGQVDDGSLVPYSVSKAALNMLSQRLRYLLADDGIEVVLLSPGWVKTDMGGPNAQISPDRSAEALVNLIENYGPKSPEFQNYEGVPIPW